MLMGTNTSGKEPEMNLTKSIDFLLENAGAVFRCALGAGLQK